MYKIMKNNLKQVFLFLVLFIVLDISCRLCEQDDIGTIIKDCKFENHREIMFYWKNECQKSSIDLPSKQITTNCDITCKEGQHLEFSREDNILICKTCPENTQPANSREITKFNEDILKNFVNNCYVVINAEMKNNQNCRKFSLNQNGSLIAGGKDLIKDAFYSYELVLTEHFKQPGRVSFSFKKDTQVKNKYVNGQFNFYMDYDLKLHNSTETTSQAESASFVSFEVEAGAHSFMWQYNLWADPTDKEEKEMSFELSSIYFEGVGDHSCIATNKTIICNENSFYDSKTKTCIQCEQDEYILDGKCKEQIICNEDFIIETHSGLCEESNVEKINYSYDETKVCLVPKGRVLPSEEISLLPPASNDKPFTEDTPLKGDNQQNSPYDSLPSGSALATVPKVPKSNNLSSNILPSGNPTLIKKNPLLELGTLPIVKIEKVCKPCAEGYLKQKKRSGSICQECPTLSYLLNGACVSCPQGTNPIKLKTIQGDTPNAVKLFSENTCESDKGGQFTQDKGCAGWVFRSEGINSGSRTPIKVRKTLIKNIDVSQDNKDSSITIDVAFFGTLEKEEFIIKLNEETSVYGNLNKDNKDTIQKTLNKRIPLNPGRNQLSFIYVKNSNESSILSEDEPSVVIKQIKIEGSNEGSGVKCSDCDENSIRVGEENNFSCQLCEYGFVPDAAKRNCVKCESIQNSDNCRTCPLFTVKNDQGCDLSPIIHNKKVGLKYDLKEFSSIINSECDGHNDICYDRFVGPIKDNKSKDFYFLSVFERSPINITDFTFTTDEDFLDKGHIFALTNSTRHTDSKHTENVKSLVNIGSQIKQVKLISAFSDERRKEIESKNFKNIFKNSGLMIEYSYGESCKTDMEIKKYKSYLFLYCDKESSHHSPRLVKKSEDGCTFYFEIRTRSVCPLCSARQVKPWQTACINEKRSIILQESDTCRISNRATQSSEVDSQIISNDLSQILTFEEVTSNTELSFYFQLTPTNQKKYYQENTFELLSEDLLNLNDNLLYINGSKIDEECSPVGLNLYSNEVYLILIIPVIWLLTGLCVVIFYCRYRKIRSEYNRLREEIEMAPSADRSKDFSNDNKLQLEISNDI